MSKIRNRETSAVRFWRALERELIALGESAPSFGEVHTLFICGYSVPQAIRVLAPGKRAPLRVVSNF